jgi:hypothetical protein
VLELLISLLLAAHLMCVNVASGAPLVAAWLDWRGTRGDEAAAKGAAYLARASLLGLLVGAALGGFIGWLKWDAEYRALWTGPLSYKLHWAAVEAIFSLVLMVGWWLWLPGRSGGSRLAMHARCLVALLASTNLLYHFPVLFSVAGRMFAAGDISGGRIGGAEFRRLMIVDETPALAVHVVLASIAMAGMMLLGFALRWIKRGDRDGAAKAARWGGFWALAPSVAQLPVGLWTLLTLPAAAQSQLMGESVLGTALFIASLGTALWLINELVHVAMGELTRGLLIRAMTAMLITVVLMTAMQQQTRGPILDGQIKTSAPREP